MRLIAARSANRVTTIAAGFRRCRRLLSCAAVLTLVASVGVGEASAPGAWSSPGVLASATGPSVPQRAVQSENRQTIAAWASSRGVFAAVAGADHRFGAAVPLAHQSILNDQAQILAVDRRGDSIVMWEPDECNTPQSCPMVGSLFVSYRPAHGRFGPVHTIATGAGRAFVGIDANGNATIAWNQVEDGGNHAIDVTVRRSDGSYGAVQTVARGGVGLGGLAVNDHGQAVIVWITGSSLASSRFAGFSPFALFAASRPAGGRFGAAVQLVSTKSGAANPTVAIDGRGNATVAWEGPYDRATTGTPFKHVEISSLSVGASAPGPIHVLQTPGSGQLGDFGPSLYENAGGDALIVWQNLTRDGHTELEAARRQARQQFGRAEAVTEDSYPGGSYAAAISPSAQSIVAWDSLSAPVQASIAASASSRFGLPRHVASSQDSAAPAVTIDADGRATAIWWDLGLHRLLYATT